MYCLLTVALHFLYSQMVNLEGLVFEDEANGDILARDFKIETVDLPSMKGYKKQRINATKRHLKRGGKSPDIYRQYWDDKIKMWKFIFLEDHIRSSSSQAQTDTQMAHSLSHLSL